MPSLSILWSVEAALFQNHLQTRCVCQMNQPTPLQELWLGHNVLIAFLHSSISEDVGCSFGQCILNLALWRGRRDSTSWLILFPEAVNKSDINNACRDTRTLFNCRNLSLLYPALSITCMMNSSPSLGNPRASSGMVL